MRTKQSLLTATRLVTAAAAAALLLVPPTSAVAKEKLRLKTSLESTIPDGSGKLIATFRPGKAKMIVIGKGLQGDTDYDVLVGDTVEVTVNSKSNGKVKVKFRTGGSPALDFDPNGATIAVWDGTTSVLSAVFSGAGEAEGTKIDERSSLAPTGLIPGASGDTRFRIKKGRTKFSVEIEDVPTGLYSLFVGGVERGVISVDALGEGEIEFDSGDDDGDELALDFDPRGEVIDITNGDGVVLSGDSTADVQGVTTCFATETEVAIASTGADADGSSDARLRTKPDCDLDFEVEIEDVPVGIYDVVIDGIVRGSITVVDDGVKVEGELEFDTDPDDPGELLLDFEPEGLLIEVIQGATTFFSGIFEAGNGIIDPGSCSLADIELPLINAGVHASAKGKARFRQESDCDADLRVEIEDVPLADYTLFTDGIERGTFAVVLIDGEPEGQIEFDNDPDAAGELPLTFDPNGSLVEVKDGAGTVVLSRQLPAS
ncbi:MAG: hypothetical protein ACI8TX_000496 [Hyphomicrobiaceae bacterium]|jgi:hypothetical protein